MFKRIAVIGGGITGVTTAYALVKRGFHVTLFECPSSNGLRQMG